MHERRDLATRPTPGGLDAAGRTVAIVLAGGKGTRLDPLTRSLCKPALPFGGTFRCIDFSLSNCVNSGIRTIGVATRYKPDVLLAHLATHWTRFEPGTGALVHAWRAEESARRGASCGTADAVYRNLASIRHENDSLVVVLAGDHVYKMDYRPMLEAHLSRDADVTIGSIEARVEDACRLGVLTVASDGRVERLIEKPQRLQDLANSSSGGALASMGIYVFDSAFLARTLLLDAARASSGHDFAADILPRIVERHRVYSYPFRSAGGMPGYWRDVGTLTAYWQAHMDLLGPAPSLTLDDPRWPLGGAASLPRIIAKRSPTADGGIVENSIVPAECRIGGQVLRSVLCDGAEVGRGAEIADAVVLPGAVIGNGSRLRGVIVDAGHRVRAGTVIERRHNGGAPPVLSTHGTATRELHAVP